MELTTDVDRGAWLLARVGTWARVGGVAGAGFEAYARILHPVPATLEDLAVADEWGMHPILRHSRWPWSEVARRVGRTMHPLVQWGRITLDKDGFAFDDGWRIGQSEEGWFDPRLLAILTEHLAVASGTPDDIVAGLWGGWGELQGTGVSYVGWDGDSPDPESERQYHEWREEERRSVTPEVREVAVLGPHLQLPDREYLLFATGLAELADPTWVNRAGIGWTSLSPGPSPQLIWPQDHAWVVASEIDWDSTIVAGSRALVDAVLADDRFEAFEVDEGADLSCEGDLVNPPRDGWSEGP